VPVDFAASHLFCRELSQEMTLDGNAHLILVRKGFAFSINKDAADDFRHTTLTEFCCNKLPDAEMQVVAKHLAEATDLDIAERVAALYRELARMSPLISREFGAMTI